MSDPHVRAATWNVLLDAASVPSSAQELAARTGLSSTTVTRYVREMVRQGALRRRRARYYAAPGATPMQRQVQHRKLTPQQVAEIRRPAMRRGLLQELAAKYGVAPGTIYRTRRRG